MLSTRPLPRPPDALEEGVRLERVPPLREVPELAGRLRESWGVGRIAPLDLDAVCRRLGVEIAERPLGAADGGAQGFLVPRHRGGFRAEIDPEPRCGWNLVSPGVRAALRRHRWRFLVCHELAHTVFYEDGLHAPRRAVPGSERQEAFCDELARALLVPRGAAAGLPLCPESVLELQHRYDVSMEIAFRSMVAAHGSAVGWLLLRRDRGIRIQWTSAEQGLTAEVLTALRSLAGRAIQAGRATAQVVDSSTEAVFVERRDQVIVTWRPSVPS